MRLSSHIKRHIAIGLSAILLILSFAASAHSVTHLDDGVNSHCTLCFHQHQFTKVLPTQGISLQLEPQLFNLTGYALPLSFFRHINVFRSRAPPSSYFS